MSLGRRGRVDTIIVFWLDRLARSLSQTLGWLIGQQTQVRFLHSLEFVAYGGRCWEGCWHGPNYREPHIRENIRAIFSYSLAI